MTYTEEQVSDLIQNNLKLAEENAKLQDELSKEKLLRESAVKKYDDLCERCMNLYITTRDIEVDTLFVQVNAPRFMSTGDFNNGITQHLITILNAERDMAIFTKTHTNNRKEIV